MLFVLAARSQVEEIFWSEIVRRRGAAFDPKSLVQVRIVHFLQVVERQRRGHLRQFARVARRNDGLLRD